MITDFHSHILPEMDDGSRSENESREMLAESFSQGVSDVVLTPHFYAWQNKADGFLAARDAAAKKIADAFCGNLYVGTEVAYFSGIGRSQNVGALSVKGTNVLLLEMPFERWDGAVVEDVLRVKETLGLTPVLAHIERFLPYKNEDALLYLLNAGVLAQANAEWFLSRKTVKKALQYVEKGRVNLIGSDAHRIDSRKPNLGEAASVLVSAFGEGALTEINDNFFRLLKHAEKVEKTK